MPVLNTADTLKLGTLDVSSAYLGTELVWELEEAPVNTVAPAVTGGPSIGSTLTCSTGTWTNSPTSYAYQWQADTGAGYADLTGETANTLDTTGMANGDDVRCKVTATKGYGSSAPATSNAVALTSGTLRIFGADDITGGGGPNSTDRMWAGRFTKTHAGAITSIFAHFENTDGAGNTARIVALTDATSAPGTVLWYTAPVAIPIGGGVVEFTLPADVSGTDGSGTYWLGAVCSDYQGATSFGSRTGFLSAVVNDFSFATPPSTAPAPGSTYSDQAPGIWCEYIG